MISEFDHVANDELEIDMLYVSTFRNYRSYDQISTLRKRGSLVVRRLPLVLEVQVRFMLAVRQINFGVQTRFL